MSQSIYDLQELVEKIRQSFHGAATAYDILVDSQKFENDNSKYVLASTLFNNSAIYISSAKSFYESHPELSGLGELGAYFKAYAEFEFEAFQFIKEKEDNPSWFISQYNQFTRAKRGVEHLIDVENENYRLAMEISRVPKKR